MLPELEILELLYAFGDVPLADAMKQVGDRGPCLAAVDDLRRRGLLELNLRAEGGVAPLPLRRWGELHRNPDAELESRVVLRRTAEGDGELGRRFGELFGPRSPERLL